MVSYFDDQIKTADCSGANSNLVVKIADCRRVICQLEWSSVISHLDIKTTFERFLENSGYLYLILRYLLS